MLDLSVIIPCGPLPETEPYLLEMVQSIIDSEDKPDEVVIIDDAAHISEHVIDAINDELALSGITLLFLKNQWNLGEAASRNIATINASNDWVFQASYDDKFLPSCLKECYAFAQSKNDKDGYYYVVLDLDDGTFQGELGAHALFHKHLWARLGGYPLVGAIGIVDMSFLDLVVTKGGQCWQVSADPLYWHRSHKNNVVKLLSGAVRHYAREIANVNTEEWTEPKWVSGFYRD